MPQKNLFFPVGPLTILISSIGTSFKYTSDTLTIGQWQVDDSLLKSTTGNARIGYCAKCGDSDFYDKFKIMNEDSKCCNDKIKPTKEK